LGFNLHTLVIFGEKLDNIAREYLPYDIDDSILPLVENLPYQRGYAYSIITGRFRGNVNADAIIEIAFGSIDDIKRVVESTQFQELMTKSGKVFKEDSLSIFSAHQI